MNYNQQNLQLAVSAGLRLLGPESGTQIPAKDIDALMVLRMFLGDLATGKLAISDVNQVTEPPDPAAPSVDD